MVGVTDTGSRPSQRIPSALMSMKMPFLRILVRRGYDWTVGVTGPRAQAGNVGVGPLSNNGCRIGQMPLPGFPPGKGCGIPNLMQWSESELGDRPVHVCKCRVEPGGMGGRR